MIVTNTNVPEKAPSVPPKDPAGPGQSNLEQLAPPPPYSPPPPPPSPNTINPAPQPSASSILNPQSPQTVNHFEVFSQHNPIAGTYLVDPLLPSPSISASLRKACRKRSKAWGKGAGPKEVHASFGTRHGPISLDLAAVAEHGGPFPPGAKKVRTCVIVSSTHGRINVNLFEIQPGRSVDLHVESRHSKILLLLPPTYDGPVMFQTRHLNSVTFLPAFAARARTLRASDRETLVICTPPPAADGSQPASRGGPSLDGEDENRVLVRTRHGKIVIGISGVDRVEDAQGAGGLWKKLGELFEVGGKAFGQYVETQASILERRLSERSAALGQSVNSKSQYGAPFGRT
ncbi:hypothetical protein BD414DRAFT_537157 [Trametes punicea]|nr:hypothetical protein BD414DRAFT_537157 [Trametes punicea]